VLFSIKSIKSSYFTSFSILLEVNCSELFDIVTLAFLINQKKHAHTHYDALFFFLLGLHEAGGELSDALISPAGHL